MLHRIPGSIARILSATAIKALSFPSGTAMLFVQTAAPTGWTKQTTHNDKALRIVSGTASSGGTNSFSTVMGQTTVGNTTLNTGQIPAHSHSAVTNFNLGSGTPALNGAAGTGNASTYGFASWWNIATTIGTDGGSGGPHNHSITMSIQYVDVIIATKD